MGITLNDVISFIADGTFTEAERALIIRTINARSKADQRSAAGQFWPGDTVEWKCAFGSPVRGTVTKVNRVTVHINGFDGRKWRVAPTLLRSV